VVLAALKGDKTLAALAEQFEVDANPITQWKSQLRERAGQAYGKAGLHAKAKALDDRIGSPASASRIHPESV
jgi:transposase